MQEDHADHDGDGIGVDEYLDSMFENCVRYLGIVDVEQIYRMSITEYEALMKAYRLRDVDMQLQLHELAWLSVTAGAQKERGKKLVPVYKRFEDFFNYDKMLAEARGEKKKSRFLEYSRHLKEKI